MENSIVGGSGAVGIEAGVRFLFEAGSSLVVGTNDEQSLAIRRASRRARAA